MEEAELTSLGFVGHKIIWLCSIILWSQNWPGPLCGLNSLFSCLLFLPLTMWILHNFTCPSLVKKVETIPKCPSIGKWINKIWYIHTMDYYLATKKNEVLIHNTTWMNFENTLSEGSRTQKATYCRIPFIWNAQNRKSLWGAGGAGGKRKWGSNCVKHVEVLLGARTMFWN